MSDVNDIIDVQLSEDDLNNILNILDFASKAADVLAKTEMTKGGGLSSAVKMNKISNNALQLSLMFSKHLDIGNPENGNVH